MNYLYYFCNYLLIMITAARGRGRGATPGSVPGAARGRGDNVYQRRQ